MSIVMTVRGPIPTDELGYTDAHSHVWIEPVPGAALDGLIHDDEDGICADLGEFFTGGGRTIIDCQPGGCGRNGNRLKAISEKSGVHIVACTGFHRQLYYPQDAPLWAMTPDQAYDFFLDEWHNGLLESQDQDEAVFPGFIKIAAEASMADSPMAFFEVVAAFSRETGLAIEMHTEKGAAIEDFYAFFQQQGLVAERLLFCHVDKRPDFKLHQELAEAGVMLEYDTFIRSKYKPEENAWPLLLKMIDAGLAGQIALATDLAESHQWHYRGGSPGAVSFLMKIRDRLVETGIPSETILMLTGGNISRRLAKTGHKEN